MSAFESIKQIQLELNLIEIPFKSFAFLNEAPCDIYGILNDSIKKVIPSDLTLGKTTLTDVLKKGHKTFLIKEDSMTKLTHAIQKQLVQVTRSLSIGDAHDNSKKQIYLLSVNQSQLYNDPNNDEILHLQFQSAKTLCQYLLSTPSELPYIYDTFIGQKHQFLHAQPFVSSIFLLGFLKQTRIMSDKEIEALFMTSYLKDIGMGLIPSEKLISNKLSEQDKLIISKHPHHSSTILENRIPLPNNYLDIIKNHHRFSTLVSSDHNQDLLFGFETTIISVMDIIAAKISDRPYRRGDDIFTTLDYTKELISTHYPSEFRLIVMFFRNFFRNQK